MQGRKFLTSSKNKTPLLQKDMVKRMKRMFKRKNGLDVKIKHIGQKI